VNKVYIVNSAGHDFSKAEKYGELIPVVKGHMNVFRPDRGLFTIDEGLKSFTKDDYLLLSGNTFGNVIAALCVAGRFSKIKMLVYDAKNNDYLCHVLDMFNGDYKFVRGEEYEKFQPNTGQLGCAGVRSDS
jgi:hypothetical protein